MSIDDVESVDGLITAMRQQAPEASEVLGMISVADDFFLMIRTNELSTRLLLSDVTAASDWPLARSVLDELGVDAPESDDDEHVEPVGDLAIVADLGLDAMELAALCDDLDLYPDEMLGSVASRLGFRRGVPGRDRRVAGLTPQPTVRSRSCAAPRPDRPTSRRCGSRSPRPSWRRSPATSRSARWCSTRTAP